MNRDGKRSSNAVIDETRPARTSIPRVTGGPKRVFLHHEQEQHHRKKELDAEKWHRGPADSLSKHSLSRVLTQMQRVMDQGRHVLQGFRSPSRPPTELEHALSELLDEIAAVASPRLRIVVTGQPKSVRSAIHEQIYLIGREALVNALRHSEATCIEAEVEYLPRWLRVVIRDNGCGIEQEMLKSAHDSPCGLRGMLERARSMGARLQIWSKPGSGTEVELSLRLDSRSMPAFDQRAS